MTTLPMILVPSLITLLISGARLTAEVNGWSHNESGGGLYWLGISWLPLVFGVWFGFRLRRLGSQPRVGKAALWSLLALLTLIASVALCFGPLRDTPPTDEAFAQLRTAVLTLAGIATALAIALAFVWPRLAFTLFCYALPARLTVIAFTWLAKHMQWHTHYTKFGPMGIERDMPTTMLSATIAQIGFWVPFTIISGFLITSWFGRRGN